MNQPTPVGIWEPAVSRPPTLVRETIALIGIRTAASPVMSLWPRWMRALTRDVGLLGVDLPVGVSSQTYADLMRWMRDQPRLLGAVVTCHELATFEHARSLLADVRPIAHQVRSVDWLRRARRGLTAYARAPLVSQRSLERQLPGGIDRRREAIVFGAGAEGRAVALSLLGEIFGDIGYGLRRASRLRQLTIVDSDQATLRAATEALPASVPELPFGVGFMPTRTRTTSCSGRRSPGPSSSTQ